ncbi:MAG: hypothetical protein Kow002_02360 [Anaerolineales bacterium]
MDDEFLVLPSYNRAAMLSFMLALLALLSFCLGAAPLPLTALFCYPASVLLALGALWTGGKALRQIRVAGTDGRRLALIGIWAGGISLLFVLCAVALVVFLWPHLAEFLQMLWRQLSTP